MMDETALFTLARAEAACWPDLDRKQLRFNEIVACALRFYPTNPAAGVRELVQSCSRGCEELYVKGRPMWQELNERYGWMIEAHSGQEGTP